MNRLFTRRCERTSLNCRADKSALKCFRKQIGIEKLPLHVRQEQPFRRDDIAVLCVADRDASLKWGTGRKLNISLVMHDKGQFTAVAQHNARLAHPAVQLQMRAGQKAFFRQIHDFAPLTGGEIADQHSVAYVSSNSEYRVCPFRSRIVEKKARAAYVGRCGRHCRRQKSRSRQRPRIAGTVVAFQLHPCKWLVANEVGSECSRISKYARTVRMIVQRNLNPLADNCVVDCVGLMVKDLFALCVPPKPAIDLLQLHLRDFFKVAVQFEFAGQHPCADIIAAIPTVRLNISNIVAFHLIAARFGARSVIAAQRRTVCSMKTESVHIVPF